jgi:hypothetical protein
LKPLENGSALIFWITSSLGLEDQPDKEEVDRAANDCQSQNRKHPACLAKRAAEHANNFDRGSPTFEHRCVDDQAHHQWQPQGSAEYHQSLHENCS